MARLNATAGRARHFATIADDSPRAEHWLRIFGTLTLEVESPEVTFGTYQDGSSDLCFMLRVASLAADQLDRLVRVFAYHWIMTPAEVLGVIRGGHGVPVPAEGVTIRTVAPHEPAPRRPHR